MQPLIIKHTGLYTTHYIIEVRVSNIIIISYIIVPVTEQGVGRQTMVLFQKILHGRGGHDHCHRVSAVQYSVVQQSNAVVKIH
jgi:hypothetical protein